MLVFNLWSEAIVQVLVEGFFALSVDSSSCAEGLAVPIPTFPLESMRRLSVPLPVPRKNLILPDPASDPHIFKFVLLSNSISPNLPDDVSLSSMEGFEASEKEPPDADIVNFLAGLAVPIPTFPLESMRRRSFVPLL